MDKKECLINPKTGRAVKTTSKLGQRLLKEMGGGSAPRAKSITQTKATPAMKAMPPTGAKPKGGRAPRVKKMSITPDTSSSMKPASKRKIKSITASASTSSGFKRPVRVPIDMNFSSSSITPASPYKSPEIKVRSKITAKAFRSALESSTDKKNDGAMALQGAVKRLLAPREVLKKIGVRERVRIKPAIMLMGAGALKRAKQIPNIAKKINAIKMATKGRINANTDAFEKEQASFQDIYSINNFIKLQSTFNIKTVEGQKTYIAKMEEFIKKADIAETELRTSFGKLTDLERQTVRSEDLRIILDGEYTAGLKEYFRTYNENILKE
jgi:hypothetical protein